MFRFQSLPIDGPLRVTSPFGKRNINIKGATSWHDGIDLGRDWSKPETNILAVSSGTVVRNYFNNYRGWVVVIRHNDTYSTLYQHLKTQSPIPVNTKVNAGDVIGVMGNSSNPKYLKCAMHLHFELRKYNKPIDPYPYLTNIVESVTDMNEKELKDFIIKVVKEIGRNTEPKRWFKDSWEDASANRIVDGSNPASFTTREEVVEIIKRAIECEK